ncbi:MAG: cysteine--tRNA ligase [Candidatus Omnitrophica bacterium]|nr:cysteine--tRNA ligase [Candidatus Omnitrophota bacterium]
MSIRIYNTLTRQKEEFVPVEAGRVRMYVCGPTVYDLLHVGNFRGAIFFNLVRNWLEHRGYRVDFVYNYTDIDDKIINKAQSEGKSALDVSSHFIDEFEKDYATLGLPPHTHNPKCSDHMDDMIRFIEDLIGNGHAYEIDGSVFYSIASFERYGKLSGKHIEDLEAGHRVDPDVRKRDPLDFILWKPAKEGEPYWESPWGRGRPGWHIECSAMNHSFLGDQIDIHGGGIDLIFPHHENEIAQTEGKTGKPFAKYWMHNNFIQFGDQKMSKSLGNVVKARDFMERYHPEILKFVILDAHYRSPLNMGEDIVRQKMQGLSRIYEAVKLADTILMKDKGPAEPAAGFQAKCREKREEIERALDDDFNTPQVFAAIFDVVRAFNDIAFNKKITAVQQANARAFKQVIDDYGRILSMLREPAVEFLDRLNRILVRERGLDAHEIQQLVDARTAARRDKDFQKSDAIRDELAGMGVELKDAPEGTHWQIKIGE